MSLLAAIELCIVAPIAAAALVCNIWALVHGAQWVIHKLRWKETHA